MDKWFKDILPDKDPYHNRGRDQMRKKVVPEFECLWLISLAFPLCILYPYYLDFYKYRRLRVLCPYSDLFLIVYILHV